MEFKYGLYDLQMKKENCEKWKVKSKQLKKIFLLLQTHSIFAS